MTVYRICHRKWASSLEASGYAARWNSDGVYMLYTSENLSLACLENIVHRRSIGPSDLYETMHIDIPDELIIQNLDRGSLPEGWDELNEAGHQKCRSIGDQWMRSGVSVGLRVPSVIIPQESNILLNTRHPDYAKISIQKHLPFSFDARLG